LIDLSEQTVETLGPRLVAAGIRPSHAGPLLRCYLRGSLSNDRTFPPALERLLKEHADRRAAALADRQVAADGTAKLLIRMADGRTVESVLMPGDRPDRAAGCLSSQVGCAMGCDFCATAKAGFERNLTSGEIVGQFVALREEARAGGRRLQTVVFMGMGEPMLNLANVSAAIECIARNEMGGLGCGQITVSTVGVVSGIDALGGSGLNVNLAVSLHAPDDETRARLLPTARRFRVGDILAAADRYQASTGRPVSVQYCMLDGVNDSLAQAGQLAELLAGRRMHVNLLRYNPTGLSLLGETYTASTEASTEAFVARLRAAGVVTHVRRSRGPDIAAACGQLRQAHATARRPAGSAQGTS
jgi:23S rRNA (adenine2503-C2)-methyltransferase